MKEKKVRTLDYDEVDVTTRLAGPFSKSDGTTVLLQQPAEKHCFAKGAATTIHECATLQALHGLFYAVTLGTVGIPDLNVVDALPFVRPLDLRGLDITTRRSLQENVLTTILKRTQPSIPFLPITFITRFRL